jgi:GNAT superfamily N-acetyltransferase
MAIKDLPVGRFSSGTGTWDYSHLLKPEQHNAGYRLHLTTDSQGLDVYLQNPQDKNIGKTTGVLVQHGKAITPHALGMLPAELRGQGFGRAMYEAMYAHAYKKMGVKKVDGGYHTAAARRVHESLARRHGLKYDPEPGFPNEREEGIRGGPYEYALSGRKLKKEETDEQNQEVELEKADPRSAWDMARTSAGQPGEFVPAPPTAMMRTPAFRHRKTGQVVESPVFHNPDYLPEGPNSQEPYEDWEDGFVDHQDKFYNRDEAARAVGLTPAHDTHPGYLESQDYVEGVRGGFYKSEQGFESPSWVKHPHLPARIQRVFDAVRANLTPDLLKPEYQGNPNPYHGHCYVATESLFHLLDGKNTGWERMHLAMPQGPHWFLQHKKTGVVLDPTAEQFPERPDYESAKPKGFSVGPPDYDPGKPSKRAQTLIDRVKPSLQKSEEDDELQELAKTVGYIKFPKLGVTDVQEPMTYPKGQGVMKRGKGGRAIFGARYQLASDPRESKSGGIVADDPARRRQHGEDVYDRAKERGFGIMGTLANMKSPTPPAQRMVSGVAMGGKVHGLVGVRAHEAQHSVFGQLAQKYGDEARQLVIRKVIDQLPPEGREAGKKVMGVSGYGMADNPEEFITSHQQFLTDERSRKSIYRALSIPLEKQREFFKLMRRNFEVMRTVAATMKPTRDLKLPRLPSKMKKSEGDLQKSIAVIPAGKILARNPTTNESLHDFTHVLPQPIQANGYRLRLQHIPRTGSIIARAYDPFGKIAGRVTTYHSVEDGEPVLGIDTSIVEKQHRGLGIGTALYEANYAYARRNLGIRKVVGSEHSEAAHRVHLTLARKHGLDYQPEMQREGAGPYDYLIKEEVGFQEREAGDREHEFVKSEDWTPEDFEQYEQVLEKAVRAGPGQLGLPGIGEDVPLSPEQQAAAEAAREKALEEERQRFIASGQQMPRNLWGATWHQRATEGKLYPEEVNDFLKRISIRHNEAPHVPGSAAADRPELSENNVKHFLNTYFEKLNPEQRAQVIELANRPSPAAWPNDTASDWLHYGHNKLTDEEFKHVMPTLSSGHFYHDVGRLPNHRVEMMLDHAKKAPAYVHGVLPGETAGDVMERQHASLAPWDTLTDVVKYTPLKNETATRILREFPKEHHRYWETASALANGSLTDDQMSSLLDEADRYDSESSIHVPSVSAVGGGVAEAATTPELQRKSIDFLLRHTRSHNLRHILARKKDLHPDVLRETLNRYPEGTLDALRNPTFPTEMLPEIAKSKKKEIRAAVAEHPSASQELAEELSNDKHASVRKAAQEALRWHDPSSQHDEHVEVKFGTNKLRQLRDHIIAQGEEAMSPKDLPPGDWKAGRDKGGNISAKKIQEHIDSLPGIKYGVSEGSWKGAQRHSKAPSYVFQLNLSTDQVHKLKEAGVYETFRRMHHASTNSGHPVGKNAGLGWVRWTGDEKGIHIDEVQSDLGQSFVRQAAAQAAQQGQDPAEAAKRAERDYPEEHYQKIKNIVFGGKHPSEVLQEAFHQYLRNEKKPDRTGYNRHTGTTFQFGGRKSHVGTTVHIWTPESKATISLGRQEDKLPGHFMVGYRDVPQKKLGMRPASYGDLPTQTGRQHQGKPTWQDTLRKREPGSYVNLGKVEE